MSDRIYIDTNILVYLYSNDSKSIIAKSLIDKHFDDIVLSTQVINEFVNVIVYKRKLKTREDCKQIINLTWKKCDIKQQF